MAFKISQLSQLSNLPTGQEIAEISNGGSGSFQVPIAVQAAGRQAKNVSVGGTTTVAATDYGDILVNTNSAVTVQLPTAASRNGVPVSVVGISSAPSITILPNGAETLIGQASLTISNQFGAFTLWPIVTGGWYQK